MIWIIATVLLLALLALILLSVPPDIIAAALFRRPLLLLFHPDNTVEFHAVRKNEATAHGFVHRKAGTVYVRKPGTAYVWKGKLVVYPVYAPLGLTLTPAWVKLIEILRDKGYNTPEKILQKLEEIERKPPTELSEEDIKTHKDLLELKKALALFGSTMDFKSLDPLVNIKDATQDFSILQNTVAQERASWADFLKRMNTAPVILGIMFAGIIGIIVVWAVLTGGAGNVAQAATQAVTHAVEGNAAAAGATIGV